MVAWETMDAEPSQPPVMRDFAEIWQAADKVVYSRTLEDVVERPDAARARVRPRGGAPDEAEAARDLASAAPQLAGEALAPGLVDECHLFLVPVVVGGATARCRTASASISSCSTSAASPTASSTCATTSGRSAMSVGSLARTPLGL